MKNLIVLLIINAGIICDGFSQQPMDYKACVEYALKNNLALKSFDYRIKRQSSNYASAYGAMLPNINASTNLNISQGRTPDPNTNQIIDADPFLSNNLSISSGITLFNGFRLQNQLKYEKYRLLATNEDYLKQKNDITYQILDSYTQYLISIGLTKIQKEQLEASEKEVYRI